MIKRIIALVLMPTLLIAGLLFYTDKLMQQPMQSDQIFMIEEGSSLRSVVKRLKSPVTEIIPVDIVKIYLKFFYRDTSIILGEYQLAPHMSAKDALMMFARGEVIEHQLTILEGWTFDQARQYLSTFPQLIDDLGTNQVALLGSLNLQGGLEGWFAPDTYYFHYGESHSDVLSRAHSRMKLWLDDAWQKKTQNIPLKSPYELLILASIIEKETGLENERPLIASVFLNRLNKGMRLQTDPTVIYGLGDAFDGDLRRSDLKSDSPYNTYRIKGLTPTPIALPSRNALLAVVTAPETQYLYFVAKGDGSSYFSTTLAEHQKAVQQYQILKRNKDYQSRPKS